MTTPFLDLSGMSQTSIASIVSLNDTIPFRDDLAPYEGGTDEADNEMLHFEDDDSDDSDDDTDDDENDDDNENEEEDEDEQSFCDDEDELAGKVACQKKRFRRFVGRLPLLIDCPYCTVTQRII